VVAPAFLAARMLGFFGGQVTPFVTLAALFGYFQAANLPVRKRKIRAGDVTGVFNLWSRGGAHAHCAHCQRLLPAAARPRRDLTFSGSARLQWQSTTATLQSGLWEHLRWPRFGGS
jgi:hypothetical protein